MQENIEQAGYRRRTNFTIVTDFIIDDPAVGKMGLLVFVALCRFADKNGYCFPGLSKIAEKARVDRRTVIREIAKLEQLGYIRKARSFNAEKKRFNQNMYEIVDKPEGVVTGSH